MDEFELVCVWEGVYVSLCVHGIGAIGYGEVNFVILVVSRSNRGSNVVLTRYNTIQYNRESSTLLSISKTHPEIRNQKIGILQGIQ